MCPVALDFERNHAISPSYCSYGRIEQQRTPCLEQMKNMGILEDRILILQVKMIIAVPILEHMNMNLRLLWDAYGMDWSIGILDETKDDDV